MMKEQNLTRKIFVIVFALQTSLLFPIELMRSIASFQHHNWTIDDGLPVNSVNTITQTPDGYLWIGTEAGLARFDGIKFEVFNHENTPAFTNDIISSLQVDRSGTLWIGTRGGGVIRYKNNTFKAITGNSLLLGSEVWSIKESLDGSIWIGSGAGLCRFANNSFTRILLPEPSPNSNRTVRALLEDRNGHTWVGAGVNGLLLVKKRGSEFHAESMGLAGIEILTLFEDRKGAIWIGTIGNGLFRYWEDRRDHFTDKDGLICPTIWSLYEDRFGNLWIGTQGGGINILPAGSDRIIAYPNQEDLLNNPILYFYQDRESSLWVGANGGGLSCLRETEIITYSTKNGLSHNNIYGVFHDSKDRIWLGTKGYGVNYFKDNQFYTLTVRSGLSSDSVVSFAEDRSGAMWFGTLGGFINCYKNGRFEVYNDRRGVLNNSFRAIYADPDGRILAGSTKGDILEFRKDKFVLIADVKFRVNTLFKDSRGNLWAGTFGGGVFLIKGNEPIDIFTEKKGLSNNIVTCMHEDKQGILWIGTIKGLNRFQDGKISIFLKKDGLPDDTVYWILEDHNADFWISSNRGIYCLSREEADAVSKGTIQNVNPSVFGKEAGMRSIECNGANQPAGCKSRDGKLWFPTTDGVSVINPKDAGRNKPPSPVVIEKILLDGECCSLSRNLTLPPGKNNLEIHYTALSFIVPAKILFKYKLEGFDKKWIEPGTNRTAYYTNLPPGKYVFRVIARSSYGVWNETGAQVTFRLKPKFHQTLFFKIVLIVLFASLLPFPFLYFKKYLHDWKVRQVKRLKSALRSKNSTLPGEETKKYIRKLMYLLEVEKIYKDSDLSIKSVASKLLMSARTLSEIINDELKMSFSEFITEFRIKEAQRILCDPKTRNKSVLDIAYDVGYNSKSAFNRAFKNITGVTPSEFRKNQGK
ncbi:MAG: Helix-turn-helix protein [Acidobacteriota bacterium]|nr:Helix-turn-helix protein [Acidobacteriota bacterium]